MAITIESPCFAEDIKPLFRAEDRDAMTKFPPHFDLWDHRDVQLYGRAILESVRTGSMPCDVLWPEDQVDLLRRWIDAGAPA